MLDGGRAANGKFLYTADTGTNSVGVFSLADPLHPVRVQELVLGRATEFDSAIRLAARETTDF